MLAIVCPGQGSQTPGFLRPWLELPDFRSRMTWLSACAGMDLVHYGTEADAPTIKDTAVAQPLIVASGLVSLLALFEHPVEGFRSVSAGAGHSVGEITAAAAAGVLTAEQAMVFVRERGAGMADSAAVTPTGMSAVMGGEQSEVVAHLEAKGLTPANMNGAGQIVAAGTLEQLEDLKAEPPAKARVVPLPVAGAFHTEHMAPALDRLSAFAGAISTHDPRIPLVSNKDGLVVHDGTKVLKRLVTQVRNPVRWDLTMETFKAMGVTGLIEIPPAGTLVGLAKRAMPGVETLAVKTPDDLDDAHRMVREHGVLEDDIEPAWRLVIAPAKGTITRAPLAEGDTIRPGETIGQVVTARDAYNAVAPHGGRIIEWLVEDEDPVSPGQPLVRLHPAGA
ncbi:acyltransferase domain-containing protein [Dermacoccus sp. 147Ba]|uniref:acyltransferase domain-containing protein n=1 Tax=unclassified Dermacoccus TaxID=2643059 RepID=UPI00101C3DF4|nr:MULTISPECIES: acyltransferase domain-containing protein [unclassified Dermacoccus]QNK51863.1 acyltransferase domain-containing protein [Dermacoccus sp. PAMC28757]RYI21997.1 acyltransferase domain-containing protein [Dermacoccus sp. 147Ba]